MRSIEIVRAEQAALTVLPTTSAVLGFQFRGRVRAEHGLLAPAGVTGIQGVARHYEYVGGAASVLVRFTPQGAACVGAPGSAFSGRSVALEDLLPAQRVRHALERLHAARDDQERVVAVEQFLLELPFRRDVVVTRALELLDAAGEEPSIRSIAEALSLSERQLERRFHGAVGVSPRGFVTLRRFERAVQLARSSVSLARAAAAAGYYDQSHFVRDFRRFSGMAPSSFFGGQR